MCNQDTESVKVAPKSVLSRPSRGNLEGTHLTRSSPGGHLPGGYLRSPYTYRIGPANSLYALLNGSTRDTKNKPKTNNVDSVKTRQSVFGFKLPTILQACRK